MTGYIMLAGGAEFGGAMNVPDRRALELAGGPEAPIGIIPAAAAPDQNHQRAGDNGVRWFTSLGAQSIQLIPLLDQLSASQPAVVMAVRQSRLIYLLGGFTHYLGQTLRDSPAWVAATAAHAAGAVIAGSSAGAMVLCSHYYDPTRDQIAAGLGLVKNACVLPHHNTFGQRWAGALAQRLPGVVLIGIDERTGMINDGPQGAWQVYGQGAVTLYHQGQPTRRQSGQPFTL